MDEIDVLKKMPPVTTVQTAGEKIYNIDHVENAGNIQNNVSINMNGNSLDLMDLIKAFQPTAQTETPPSHAMEWASLDSQHYCLFVLEDEVYEKGAFSVAKDLALEEHTCEELRKKYMDLASEQKDAIKKMPCIFARRNEEYKNAGVCQVAYLGRLTDICVQGETIKFCFAAFATIPQQKLNEQADLLGIWHAPLRNEFDFEHWSIINGNLIQSLTDLGVSVL